MPSIVATVESRDFGYVLLCTVGMALQVVLHGARFAGLQRGIFKPESLAACADKKAYLAMLKDHKEATGEEALSPQGYPDMGHGRIADLLPYAKWLAFANGQRVHYNYVEGVATSILLTLVAGLYQPVWAARLGALYIAGREVFALGYAARGPSGRMYGAVLFDVALVGLLGLAAHGAYAHTQA